MSGDTPIPELPRTTAGRRQDIYRSIDMERTRQDRKWGDQSGHSMEHWITILVEEVGEVAQASLDYDACPHSEVRYVELCRELTQVAAVAVAMLEASAQQLIAEFEEETR